MTFKQIFQFFFGQRAKNTGPTDEDLNRMDVAFEKDIAPFDCEKVMVQDGEVVGETAIINERQELERTNGRLPKK